VRVVTSTEDRRPILTIGYGLREMAELVELLHRNGVRYVCDVRSAPYSRRRPEFSRQPLDRVLRSEDFRYVFLGDVLGGRPDDPQCYDEDGHVDYDRCRTNPVFEAGIRRVETAYWDGHALALLCSEARPEDCHRSKLLAEMLVERGVAVAHIDGHGDLMNHSEIAAKLRGPQLSLAAGGLGRSRRAYHAA
jgi:uncharacterized protein (DUF488 family)